MRVFVYPADQFACGHYRMVWPALAVQHLDPSLEVTVVPAGDPSGLTVYSDRHDRVADVGHPECDVIVLQRPTFPQVAAAVPFLRRRGIAVVVDIDDDLSAINPANPAYAAMHPNKAALVDPRVVDRMRRRGFEPRPNRHSWRSVDEACAAATMTTVSTPALLSRYGRGNGVVLHNYVPRAALDIGRVDSACVGWAGSTHSHPGDLRVLGPSIARLGVPFSVVGNGAGADRELGLTSPVPDTGQVEFADWPAAVAMIGVGVAPLAETRFNEAKSWLKPLEYSAVGVPWVASPRAEYRALAGLGAGLLAEKPREWERALRRLTSDAAYRAEQSEAVRAVARTLTIEEHAWRWVEAWQLALDRQHGRVRA
jgi:hypothetical protein